MFRKCVVCNATLWFSNVCDTCAGRQLHKEYIQEEADSLFLNKQVFIILRDRTKYCARIMIVLCILMFLLPISKELPIFRYTILTLTGFVVGMKLVMWRLSRKEAWNYYG